MASYGIDQRYLGSGVRIKGISGEAIRRGQAVYMLAADGLWYLADADAVTSLPSVGVSLDTVAIGRVFDILVLGLIGRSDWAWTRGDSIYVSSTAGALTQTAPVAPAHAQPVAVAITSTMIFVNATLSTVENEGVQEWYFKASDPDGNVGQHPGMRLTDDVDVTVRSSFVLPTGFDVSTWSVDVLLIPAGTGDLRRGVVTDFGEVCDEDYDTHEDSIAAGQVAVTTKKVECIDVTAALTGSGERDLVGMEFTRYGSHASDTVNADCYFIGVLIRRP